MKDYKTVVLVALRLAMGGLMLYAGVTKLMDDFTANGFLLYATSGPFAAFFQSMADSSIVDILVVWGEILIGVALLTGVFTRLASYAGALMMLLFYVAALPAEHGPISEHIIYILVFAQLAASGAGRYFGLGRLVEESKFIQSKKYLRFLLG